MNNKEKDTDKILGMNRIMFFVIVILLCILSLSIGIYAQVFYRYSDTDPFMLGIGVGKTQEKAEITALKNGFNDIFTNDISGNTSVNVKKKQENRDIVFTYQKVNEREEDKYNIVANIPHINIDSTYAEKLNQMIDSDYADRIEKIIEESDSNIDYSVAYKAYLNGDLLSLIIRETIHEGKETQSAKIRTYNYYLAKNTEVSVMDIVEAKKLDKKNMQNQIYEEIEDNNKKMEQLKAQNYSYKTRDKNDNMYKLENTENFIVNNDGYLYIIYAYGNKENTTTIDLVIFE